MIKACEAISDGRWQKAQDWEYSFWRTRQLCLVRNSLRRPFWKWPVRMAMQFLRLRDYDEMPIGDDWNLWWADHFHGYDVLPKHIGNMLEIGCGPHTNTRMIMKGRVVDYAVCSDPLLRQYLTLPRSWLRWAIRHGVVCGDEHPAEKCSFASNYFDVVVMINVLEHTCDPEECLRQAYRVLSPGGYLILGNDTLAAPIDGLSEVGHPYSFSSDWLDRAVSGSYDVLQQETLSPENGRHPEERAGCWLFIGRKRQIYK